VADYFVRRRRVCGGGKTVGNARDESRQLL